MSSTPKVLDLNGDGNFVVTRKAPPTFYAQAPSTPGLTKLERWLTRRWPCVLWTGGVGCPCLRRWKLLDRLGWSLLLHRFFADDWSLDLHDHSSKMVSVGLWGAYEEETPQGRRTWSAPWVRSFPASHTHRLRLMTPVVWTLVWVGRQTKRSGFWAEGRWWTQSEYLRGLAKARKSC